MMRLFSIFGFAITISQSAAGQTIPDEMAIAKVKFQKAVEKLNAEKPEELNAKYAAGIERVKEQKQKEGELKPVLALTAELETIKKTGAPGKDKVAPESTLGELRAIYNVASMAWNNKKVTRFETLKARYIKDLKSIMETLTKAGKIEQAIMVRTEATEVQEMTLANSGATEPDAPMSLPGNSGGSSEVRAGVIRGFGKLMKHRPNPTGGPLDLSPLEEFDDIVDVKGNHVSILFRRKNGEVIDHLGEVRGQNAVKLIATGDYGGYLDEDGNYHVVWNRNPPPEAQPMRAMSKFFSRAIALKTNGEVVGWGNDYKNGIRVVPEKARHGVKQLGLFHSTAYALREDGVLLRWGKDGEIEVPEVIRSGVKQIAIQGWAGFALSSDNVPYWLNGAKVPNYQKKAKKILTRGEFAAFLGAEDNRWEVHAHNKTPLGNELEVLNVVMNRKETIDVEFYLNDSRSNDQSKIASYAVWIEEPGAPPLNVTNVTELQKQREVIEKEATTTTGSRTGFFGVELD